VELEEVPTHRKDRADDWPKPLLAADFRWALGTFSSQPRGSRLLRVHAAAAVAKGIAPERVLRAITRDAAEILGIGDQLGSIAVGKQADVAIFAADPLDSSAAVRLVVSGGKIIYQATVSPVHAPLVREPVPQLPTRLPAKYALKTQRLLTASGCGPGMVVVENGKVAEVGAEVAVSDGVATIDLGSAVLTAGLIAAHNDLGLSGAIDDPAEADAGQVRAADAYDPQHSAV